MGSSANARLSYGIAYDLEEIPEAAGEAWDVQDRADRVRAELQAAAVPRPALDFDHARARADPEYARPWDAWQAARDAWAAANVDTMSRGYSENAEGPVLYIGGSRKSAEWGEVVPVTDLAVGPDWDDKLREFVTRLGLPWKQPGWVLTAYYG